jgi:hypothetical protein
MALTRREGKGAPEAREAMLRIIAAGTAKCFIEKRKECEKCYEDCLESAKTRPGVKERTSNRSTGKVEEDGGKKLDKVTIRRVQWVYIPHFTVAGEPDISCDSDPNSRWR